MVSTLDKTINGRTPDQWSTYFKNRETNAKRLVKKGFVVYETKKINQWYVLSQQHKHNSEVYTIHWIHENNTWYCTCPQHKKEPYVFCKHIRAVQIDLENNGQGLVNSSKIRLPLDTGFLIRLELEIRKNDLRQEREKEKIKITV